MAVDLSKSLVIAISSRALFDLDDANRVFDTEGVEAYREYQIHTENRPLKAGCGFPLIKAILELNRKAPSKRKAEVVVMSRNSPDTSLRIFNSIKHHKLDISRAVLSGGAPIAPYLKAFHVSLFLSSHQQDVQDAIDAGFAAGLLYQPPGRLNKPISQIRVALDGDAVVFSEESERVYKKRGLQAFLEHEKRNARRPLPKGPFAKLLQTLSFLQTDRSFKEPPVRLALVTARNMPAHERVIRTLRTWKVRIDEAFFMGGVPKTAILEAFQPHIFFDDQDAHCNPASKICPTARVPYKKGSPLAMPNGNHKGRHSHSPKPSHGRFTGR